MSDKQKTPLETNRLRWTRWFILPRTMPKTRFEQQQSKQLSFYLLLVALAIIAYTLISTVIGNVNSFAILALFISITLYSASRLFYYKIVVSLACITFIIAPYILIFADALRFPIATVVFCLVITLLLASQFLSLRANLQFALIIFITVFYFTNLLSIKDSISALSFFTTTFVIMFLTILNAYGREQLLKFARQNENPTQAIFFQNAINLMPNPAMIQIDKTIVAVNDVTSHLIGVDKDAIIGQPASNYISVDESSNYTINKQADNLTVSYDDLFKSQQGNIPVRVTSSSITYEESLATLIILTPYKKSTNKQILEKLIDACLNAVIVTDTNLDIGPHILMVNPAFCTMTGYSEAELIGQTPHILHGELSDLNAFDNLRFALKQGAKDFRKEIVNYRKDGSLFHALIIIRPFYDDGELTHYISVLQEISQEKQGQGNLTEREENLSIISDVMTDYAYIFEVTKEQTLHFSWITGAIEDITGLTYEQAMMLDDWRSIIHEDDQVFYDQYIKGLLDGQAQSLDYRIWHKDGSIHWIQDKAHPIVNEQTGKIIRILGAVHDISEQIDAQETLKTYVVQQAVIAELGLLALNTDDLDTLLNHIIILCEQVLHLGFIAIFEHHLADNLLTCIRISKDNSPFKLDTSIVDNPKHSLVAYTLNSSEAVISDSLADETRFSPLKDMLGTDYKSAIGVVILGDNAPFGVLTAYSKEPAYFAHDEIYFLQSIANILGTFIVRSHAQIAEREQTEFAEALRDATSVINSRLELPEVLDKIISYVQQVVPQTQQASIMLLNEETQHYHYNTTWGFAEDAPEISQKYSFLVDKFPLLKLMNDTAVPVYITDTNNDARWVKTDAVKHTRAYLGAPIIVDDEIIGFINLYGSTVGAFDDEDAKRLKTFADKTSTAIVNARKQEDLERKVLQRTQELRQEREQLEAIFSGTGDGIIFYTEHDHITFVNDAICQMTGFTSGELIGHTSALLYPIDITPLELEKFHSMKRDILENKIWRDTVRLRRKDGSTFEAGLTISPVLSSDPKMVRSVTIMRDMSREKELEDLKRKFIAAAAHDLRSPISSLKLRLYMIKQEPELIDKHLERITEIIDHVNHLVSDLLDAHGRIVLRPQNIILQDVLDSVVDNLSLEAHQKKMDYIYQASESPVPILADEHRLTQVFTNLISNAIHYTDKKGRITIRVKPDAKTVQIEVEDTGNGIPLDEQESIFLPFYRAKDNESKGNGLGLSITKEIIELHNGTISVTSVVGQGSTFTVVLPLSEVP